MYNDKKEIMKEQEKKDKYSFKICIERSERKLLTLIKEEPQAFRWWKEFEDKFKYHMTSETSVKTTYRTPLSQKKR